MKKLLTLSVLFAFLLSGMIYATETRVLTMGNANEIVKDEANVFLFPSTITKYPKLVGGEFRFPGDYVNDTSSFVSKSNGFTGMTDFYAHWTFGENSNPMTLGTYFYTNDDGIYWPTILQDWDFGLDYTPPQNEYYYYDKKDFSDLANRRIVLMYGRKLGGMPFGFNFDYMNAKEDIENDYNRSLSRYGFTVGLSPMQEKLEVSAGIALTTWTMKYDDTAFVKPDGNMAFSFHARYWMDPMGKYTLVPHFAFTHEKQGAKEPVDFSDPTAGDDNYELTGTMFALGMGLNYDAGEDALLVGDFGIQYISAKAKYTPQGETAESYKFSNFVLPYFKAGIDAKVLSWLKFRGGMESYWHMRKYSTEPATDEAKFSEVSTTTYLGAGFHWSKLNLDAQIDPDFLVRGPYFVSGESDYMAVKLSLAYWID